MVHTNNPIPPPHPRISTAYAQIDRWRESRLGHSVTWKFKTLSPQYSVKYFSRWNVEFVIG